MFDRDLNTTLVRTTSHLQWNEDHKWNMNILLFLNFCFDQKSKLGFHVQQTESTK